MEPMLILFDVDGTLIDTAGAGRRAMQRAFEEVFGVDPVSNRAASVRFAGMTDGKIFVALARAAGIDGARLREGGLALEQAYVRQVHEEMSRPDDRRRVLPGVPQLLDLLAGMPHVHLGLVTGNLEAGARAKLEPFGLNAYFATGGFASDHADRREIARIAVEKISAWTGLAFPEDRVVVVGDTEHDVDCARANGYRAVAVESGWVPLEVLQQARPDSLLEDLGNRERVLAALGVRETEPGC